MKKELRLSHLISRYEMDMRLKEQHPEQEEYLNERINKHREMIADFVLSDKMRETSPGTALYSTIYKVFYSLHLHYI